MRLDFEALPPDECRRRHENRRRAIVDVAATSSSPTAAFLAAEAVQLLEVQIRIEDALLLLKLRQPISAESSTALGNCGLQPEDKRTGVSTVVDKQPEDNTKSVAGTVGAQLESYCMAVSTADLRPTEKSATLGTIDPQRGEKSTAVNAGDDPRLREARTDAAADQLRFAIPLCEEIGARLVAAAARADLEFPPDPAPSALKGCEPCVCKSFADLPDFETILSNFLAASNLPLP